MTIAFRFECKIIAILITKTWHSLNISQSFAGIIASWAKIQGNFEITLFYNKWN